MMYGGVAYCCRRDCILCLGPPSARHCQQCWAVGTHCLPASHAPCQPNVVPCTWHTSINHEARHTPFIVVSWPTGEPSMLPCLLSLSAGHIPTGTQGAWCRRTLCHTPAHMRAACTAACLRQCRQAAVAASRLALAAGRLSLTGIDSLPVVLEHGLRIITAADMGVRFGSSPLGDRLTVARQAAVTFWTCDMHDNARYHTAMPA